MGSGLTRIFFVEKSSQNSSKPVLIVWSSIPCVFCLYIHYDLSVLSMSMMGLKKKLVWGVGGWGELYPNLFGFKKQKTFQSP